MMFKCKNENNSHCKWFQINDANGIYTNDSKKILFKIYKTLQWEKGL